MWSKGLHPHPPSGKRRACGYPGITAPILSRKIPKTVTVQVDAIVAYHCATSCSFPHHKGSAPQSCRKQGSSRQSPGRYSWRSCPRTRLRISTCATTGPKTASKCQTHDHQRRSCSRRCRDHHRRIPSNAHGRGAGVDDDCGIVDFSSVTGRLGRTRNTRTRRRMRRGGGGGRKQPRRHNTGTASLVSLHSDRTQAATVMATNGMSFNVPYQGKPQQRIKAGAPHRWGRSERRMDSNASLDGVSGITSWSRDEGWRQTALQNRRKSP